MAETNRRTKSAFYLLSALSVVLSAITAPSDAYTCAITGTESYQPTLAEVNDAFNRAGAGTLGPNYPGLPPLTAGYPDTSSTPGTVPCVILKAIGYVESSWHQATHSANRGTTGASLVSGGCGYGIMQITSGMRNPGELAPEMQQKLATDYVYNVAYGASMLAGKWNYCPGWIPAIGNHNPRVAEDWYYTVWSYNTWSWRNNPNNPDYPAIRPVFDGSQSRGDYPYQELVWGYAVNPPKSGGSPLWPAVNLSFPDRTKIGTQPGNIQTPQPSHEAACIALSVSPNTMQFAVEPGRTSPFQKVALEVVGGSAPTWTAKSSQNWIKIIPPSGSTTPASLYIAVDASSLPRGRYTARVVIDAPGVGGSPFTLSIDVLVGSTYRLALPFVPRTGR